jgi:GNAT superfamily N-acetyltransferase
MFSIRTASPADVPALPDIERSAGEAFLAVPDLAWIATDDVQSEARHRALIEGGAAWVATDANGDLLGFLSGEQIGRRLHIWELAVLRRLQGQGIGRALMENAVRWAKTQNLTALTLTTFRDVPWNEPFYRRLGFSTLAWDDLTTELRTVLEDEVRNGLPREKRCAMEFRIE